MLTKSLVYSALAFCRLVTLAVVRLLMFLLDEGAETFVASISLQEQMFDRL